MWGSPILGRNISFILPTDSNHSLWPQIWYSCSQASWQRVVKHRKENNIYSNLNFGKLNLMLSDLPSTVTRIEMKPRLDHWCLDSRKSMTHTILRFLEKYLKFEKHCFVFSLLLLKFVLIKCKNNCSSIFKQF